MKIAVFPGSFDPITKAHVDLVERGLKMFDKVIVAMGINSAKKYYFNQEQRLEFLEKTFEDYERVEVDVFNGLTAFYCKEKSANFLIRGLRNSTDFNYEYTIANLNATIGEEIESIFFMSRPDYSCFSSTVVREILKGGGDADLFLPEQVAALI